MSIEDQKKEIALLEQKYANETVELIKQLCVERGVHIVGIPNNMHVGQNGIIVSDWGIIKV